MAHEQALAAGPNVEIINFKSNDQQRNNNSNHVPINLTTLQNLPLQNLTIKDQHLLKPPVVMDASRFYVCCVKTFSNFIVSQLRRLVGELQTVVQISIYIIQPQRIQMCYQITISNRCKARKVLVPIRMS